jgi:NAD(P)-dependent dehydrogenase (short-subunit alcohol dehydrogenase family)
MDKFLDLCEKSFVVSGAGSGIGRSVAVTCAALGAKLLLIDKEREGLEITSDLINGRKPVLMNIDLTDYEQLSKSIDEKLTELGSINGFCHCAGIEYTLPIKSMTPKHYQDLFAVNVIAGFELARILSKKKYSAETGSSFVFIASTMGVVGRPGLIGYSASKGAVIAGMRSMALELAGKGIRVNSISPGTVMTDMIKKMLSNLEPEKREKRLEDFPMGVGKPEDVADLVAFLFSERSRWMTGTNIMLDGGYTAR